MNQEQNHTNLCKWIREWEVGDLPSVLQVHDPARHLLEGTRKNGGRCRENARLRVQDHRALDPLKDDFDFIGGLFQERKAGVVNSGHIKNFERSCVAGTQPPLLEEVA